MNTVIERIEKNGKTRLIESYPAGSLNWLNQRKEGIGGSDISSCLGKSPYKSGYTLWAEKSGYLQDREPSPLMRTGQILEPAILQLFKENHLNLSTHSGNLTFASTENNRFRANPDAIVENEFGDMSILEIKYTTRYWKELPENYVMQVMWYQYVTGLHNTAILAALTPYGYSEYSIDYDPELVEQMKQAALTMLSWIDLGTEPGLEGSENTLETVRSMIELDEEQEIELDAELYKSLMHASDMLDFWQKMLNLRKSEVIRAMQGAKYGNVEGTHVVSLRQRGQGLPYLHIER
jgi:putative phage-type endonuclease